MIADAKESEAAAIEYGNFFNSAELSDLVIVTDTRSFYAHKTLLAMASPFFKT